MPLTILRQSHHAAGSAPDNPPLQLDFAPPVLRLDLSIFDNPVLVAFSSDGIFFSTEREFPAGMISSLDLLVASLRIRNKTALSVGRYDATGYYSPIEIVGEEFKLQIRTP